MADQAPKILLPVVPSVHNASQVVDNGEVSIKFNDHACYSKFWEMWELAFFVEMMLFQQLCTLLGMRNGIKKSCTILTHLP